MWFIRIFPSGTLESHWQGHPQIISGRQSSHQKIFDTKNNYVSEMDTNGWILFSLFEKRSHSLYVINNSKGRKITIVRHDLCVSSLGSSTLNDEVLSFLVTEDLHGKQLSDDASLNKAQIAWFRKKKNLMSSEKVKIQPEENSSNSSLKAIQSFIFFLLWWNVLWENNFQYRSATEQTSRYNSRLLSLFRCFHSDPFIIRAKE